MYTPYKHTYNVINALKFSYLNSSPLSSLLKSPTSLQNHFTTPPPAPSPPLPSPLPLLPVVADEDLN